MGQRHSAFEHDPRRVRGLASVFRALEEIHPGGRRGLLDDLFEVGHGSSASHAKVRRLNSQNWRRWISGNTIPKISEIRRILGFARNRGWLQRINCADYELGELETAIGVSAAAERVNEFARSLARARSHSEHQAWIDRLAFVSSVVTELMEVLHYSHRLSKDQVNQQFLILCPATSQEALGMFRATMLEIACQSIEAIDEGLQRDAPCLPATEHSEDPELWAAVLVQMGDDLQMLFRNASTRVRAKDGSVKSSTKNARERLYALSEETRGAYDHR